MKVELKLFLPMLAEAVGQSELSVELSGSTVGDLMDHLKTKYGRRAVEALNDNKGELDPEIQVLVGGKKWITKENLDTRLNDGDQVTIMVMMAGG